MLVAKRRLSRFGGKWRRLIGSRKKPARSSGPRVHPFGIVVIRANARSEPCDGRVVDQDVEFSKAVVAIKYS